MEENVGDKQELAQDTVGGNSSSDIGVIPNELKKEELQDALKETILDLENLCQHNTMQVFLISIINLALLAGAYCFGSSLYDNTEFAKYWDLRIIYYTGTRILLATTYISIIIFTLNLLKFYLNNAKLNRDKLLIARSMSGLLAAGSGFIERNVVYGKLLDIIISDNTKPNCMDKDESMKIESYQTLLDLMKEVLKKK